MRAALILLLLWAKSFIGIRVRSLYSIEYYLRWQVSKFNVKFVKLIVLVDTAVMSDRMLAKGIRYKCVPSVENIRRLL